MKPTTQNKPWIISIVILVVAIGIISFQWQYLRSQRDSYLQTQMWLKQVATLTNQKLEKENEYTEKMADLVIHQQAVARLITETTTLSWEIKSVSGHINEINTSLLLLKQAIWKSSD